MITTKTRSRTTLRTTLVVIAAVVVLVTAGRVAFGQSLSNEQQASSIPQVQSAIPMVEVRPYISPFGSPNSTSGAPMGPVGNTGTNQIPGVVGRNPGFGNATGSQTFPTFGTVSGTTQSAGAGSPQAAGPLNSAPNGASGTYGYPNSAIDPNAALNNTGATSRNSGPGRSTPYSTPDVNSIPFEEAQGTTRAE